MSTRLVLLLLICVSAQAFACRARNCYGGCGGASSALGRAVVGYGYRVVPQGPVDIGVYPGHSSGQVPPAGFYPYVGKHGTFVPGPQPVIPGQVIPVLQLPRPEDRVRQEAFTALKGVELANHYKAYKQRVLGRLKASSTGIDQARAKGIFAFSPLVHNVVKQELAYLEKGAPIYQAVEGIEKASDAKQREVLANENKQKLASVLVKLELLDILATFNDELLAKVNNSSRDTMIRALYAAGEKVRAIYATEQSAMAFNPQTIFTTARKNIVNSLPNPYDTVTRRFANTLRAGATHTVANEIQALALGQLNQPPVQVIPSNMIARR